jgi:hypothetical protein
MLGAFVALASLPMAALLLVAIFTLRSHKTRGVRRESPRKSPVELGLPRWVLDRTGSGIQG